MLSHFSQSKHVNIVELNQKFILDIAVCRTNILYISHLQIEMTFM
jgi:hypothetical protein